MPKVQIASDLHLEHLESAFPKYRAIEEGEADVLILAGDIHRNFQAITSFADWPKPVIYVPGNHELYGADIETYDAKLGGYAKQVETNNFHVLQNEEVVIAGVRFLGCTLWTDFKLNGADRVEFSKRNYEHALADCRSIQKGDRRIKAEDVLERHLASREWLEERLATHFDGKTVIVTHHTPHPKAIHPRYISSNMNAGFTSDLSELIERYPFDLWVFGHTHDCHDFMIGEKRFICNPRGYPINKSHAQYPSDLRFENPHFDPCLIVDLK